MKKTFIWNSMLILALLSACSTADNSNVNNGQNDTQSTVEKQETNKNDTENQDDVEDTEENTSEPVEVHVMGMTGPTSMGMVYMMEENALGNLTKQNYEFTIAASIDEVTPQIVSGSAGIAAVPANIGAVLYQNTDGGVQVLAVNTLGVLYIVENGESIQAVSDLEGKTILASGKGSTPEYALNYILEANGLTDSVTVEWKSEQAEVVAALAATENSIAMLPQPFVTTAQLNQENLRIALDLTEEWNATDSEGMLVTGIVVGNKGFIQENPEAVDDFLKNYEISTTYAQENVDETAVLVGKYEIVPEAVAKIALPYCSITYLDGAEMEQALTGYYAELFAQNPAAIGGAMPEAEFFYGN